MYLTSHLSQAIGQIGSGNNFTANVAEWLQIGNVKEPDRSTSSVNYIPPMLMYTDWSTSLHYMEETLVYCSLQVWYDIASVNIFNILFAADH
jgi:hypothetical protein